MDVLGSHEWNFGGSESPYEGENFDFADAFRISVGVSAKVPQALRNLACTIYFIQPKRYLSTAITTLTKESYPLV